MNDGFIQTFMPLFDAVNKTNSCAIHHGIMPLNGATRPATRGDQPAGRGETHFERGRWGTNCFLQLAGANIQMPIDDNYMIPEPVIQFLVNGNRSFLALRIVHGLLYAFHRSLKGNMRIVPSQFSKEHSVRTSILAAAVGPEKSKDNRWLHSACQELADQKIFDTIQVEGRRLRFRLSRKFSDSFAIKSRAFAIMQTAQVRACRTMHDLMFLSLACLHGGKDHPKFYLPRLPERLEIPVPQFKVMVQKAPEQATWRSSWSKSNRSWVKAAQRISQLLDQSYLIGPQQDMIDDFVTSVVVKIQHQGTKWQRHRLYKFEPGTRGVIEIRASGEKAVLNAQAFQHKAHQTKIE